MTAANAFPIRVETADIETSSADYARRFSGKVGEWFLSVQEDATLSMLADYPDAEILDVGGGHGQLTEALIRHGYRVTIFGSDPICRNRIQHFLDQNLCTFNSGNLLKLPYPDRSFDIVVSYRLLPHVTQWRELLAEFARIAREAIIVDYPEVRSINFIAPYLFRFKKNIEGNTRPFTCFKSSELLNEFQANHFTYADRYPEFFLPMVLHRKLNLVRFSTTAETLCRTIGLTKWLGSPVIMKVIRERV